MKFYMIAFLSAAIVASNFAIQAEETTAKTVKTAKNFAKKSLSQEDALNLLNDAASQVQMGAVYFSSYIPSDLYQVLTVAIDSNEQQVVVYQALFGINAIWVRPLSEWVALIVDANGNTVPHFQLLTDENSVFESDVVVDDADDSDIVVFVGDAGDSDVQDDADDSDTTQESEVQVLEDEDAEEVATVQAEVVAAAVTAEVVCASCLASVESEVSDLL